MDNQHKKIKGYRDFTQEELNIINLIKQHGESLNQLFAKIESTQISEDFPRGVDKRWLAIAKTDMQKGMMALVRSVAQPDSF